ncbi:tail fiber protein [Saccharophagus degradans]|uniref:phage tail protein n=1 Tax=Saccharophagus degradans TaxID=86304 RepID=UPI001C07F375|nr:tail fiber protein [Saccharophagus degradans]MBU2987018.1 tail fiber protein [Saccharophagus degradans]
MDNPIIGQIQAFGFHFAPRNWSYCSGQAIAISQNTALFSLLGTTYGGDGRSTFMLPNLNGRTAVGMGQAAGTSVHWNIGKWLGADTHTLTIAEMPSHSHPAEFTLTDSSLTASVEPASESTPSAGAYLAQTVAGPSPADQPEKIYTSDLGASPVGLGGLTVEGTVAIGNAGQSMPFNIVQPSLAINYSIALFGMFPSRS